MTDHPSTYKAEDTHSKGVEWDDRAALRRKNEGQGLFDAAKALKRGTLAELVRHVMMLPEAERSDYVIWKAGDHMLTACEIASLAARDDFPR